MNVDLQSGGWTATALECFRQQRSDHRVDAGDSNDRTLASGKCTNTGFGFVYFLENVLRVP
jgi:hypothetical protein